MGRGYWSIYIKSLIHQSKLLDTAVESSVTLIVRWCHHVSRCFTSMWSFKPQKDSHLENTHWDTQRHTCIFTPVCHGALIDSSIYWTFRLFLLLLLLLLERVEQWTALWVESKDICCQKAGCWCECEVTCKWFSVYVCRPCDDDLSRVYLTFNRLWSFMTLRWMECIFCFLFFIFIFCCVFLNSPTFWTLASLYCKYITFSSAPRFFQGLTSFWGNNS